MLLYADCCYNKNSIISMGSSADSWCYTQTVVDIIGRQLRPLLWAIFCCFVQTIFVICRLLICILYRLFSKDLSNIIIDWKPIHLCFQYIVYNSLATVTIDHKIKLRSNNNFLLYIFYRIIWKTKNFPRHLNYLIGIVTSIKYLQPHQRDSHVFLYYILNWEEKKKRTKKIKSKEKWKFI